VTEPRYEYAVRSIWDPIDKEPPHRKGLTREEAHKWVKDWVAEGGNPRTFVVIRRHMGHWELDPECAEASQSRSVT